MLPRIQLSRTRPVRTLRRIGVAALAAALRVWVSGRLDGSSLPDLLARLRRISLRLPNPQVEDAWVVTGWLFSGGRSGQCLDRAFVLFALLHGGAPESVRFCLGVAPHAVPERDASSTRAARDAPPHFAHAWIESDGRPVGEPSDPRETHRLMYGYPPSS